MATRYERFKQRQAKWTARMRRCYRHNGKTSMTTTWHHGGGKNWVLRVGPLQAAHGVKIGSFHGYKIGEPGPQPIWLIFSQAAYKIPPHVKNNSTANIIREFWNRHAQEREVGFQIRRVYRWGKKVGRMNGTQRRTMGADWFAFTQGYYPNWDPAQRYPNLLDLLSDPTSDVSGVWPWGPPPPAFA